MWHAFIKSRLYEHIICWKKAARDFFGSSCNAVMTICRKCPKWSEDWGEHIKFGNAKPLGISELWRRISSECRQHFCCMWVWHRCVWVSISVESRKYFDCGLQTCKLVYIHFSYVFLCFVYGCIVSVIVYVCFLFVFAVFVRCLMHLFE